MKASSHFCCQRSNRETAIMFLSSRYLHSWILIPVLVSAWFSFGSPLFADRNSRVATEIYSGPVAVNDSYTVHGQATLTPMDNDYDPDGNWISLYWAYQPQHGTATVVSSTQISSVAAAGYVGSDSFTYTIRSGAGLFATATITITVVNQSPVAVTDSYTIHVQGVVSPRTRKRDIRRLKTS